MAQSEFVGVDGCHGGWFSVGFDHHGDYEVKVSETLRDLLVHYGGARLILVDIPIGLPEGGEGRDCDRYARKLLGRPRGSSIFPTPTRQTAEQALRAPGDYMAAAVTEREVAEKGISRQAFAIAPKIAEVDEVMAARGTSVTPLFREVHPELCFWAVNNQQPMEFPKTKPGGVAERLRVLQMIEPRAQEIYGEALSGFRRRIAAKDDILDALVAAVTAYRGHGRLQTVPRLPPKDARGLSMEMVFYTRG